LYGQPTEISKKIRVSIGQTNNILNDLLQAGVVEKERQGKAGLYSLVDLTSDLRLYKTLNTGLNIAPLVKRRKRSSAGRAVYEISPSGYGIH
jgi:DNA-binding transcriptional ArsR family regulator